MPSRQRQKGIIIDVKNKNKNSGRIFLIASRTGFMDVWINGTHFYYNNVTSQSMDKTIDITKTTQPKQQNQKQTITITKKSG